jgi:hypothetical protein
VSGFRGLLCGGLTLLLVLGLVALPFLLPSARAATVLDNFNRANGGLGANWTTVRGTTAPQIVDDTAQPGSAGKVNSAYWSANTFGSDQYAAASFSTNSGSNYGPAIAVRLSNSTGYFLWYGNSTSTVSIWRMNSSSSWTELKASAKLTMAATDVWQLQAVGSTLTGYQNGTPVVTTTDTHYKTGAPGIWMYYATSQITNWYGGDVDTTSAYSVGGTVSGLNGTVVLQDDGGDVLTANGAFTFPTRIQSGSSYNVTVANVPAGQTCAVFNGSGTVGSGNVTSVVVVCTASLGGSSGLQVQYLGTDASGVQNYQVTSPDNGPGPQALRVLQPNNPAPGVAHNFLYVLPVEPGEGTTFGDGLQVIQSLGLQNKYNLTVIEPSFSINPWYADNTLDASLQEDTFMAVDLQPWVKANLSTTGREQSWLIGFSKSGIGAQTLILRHPDTFTLAASWDFPADMDAYDEYGTNSSDSYGTDANFQANYRLTPAFLAAHAAPFKANNRIWIGGYHYFQQDIADYDALLTAEGVQHTTETPTAMAHEWGSGWVPIALAALEADSLNMH